MSADEAEFVTVRVRGPLPPDEPEIWVVVCQNDQPGYGNKVDPDGPIVMERYTRGATREAAMQACKRFERLGACRIARLVFD